MYTTALSHRCTDNYTIKRSFRSETIKLKLNYAINEFVDHVKLAQTMTLDLDHETGVNMENKKGKATQISY